MPIGLLRCEDEACAAELDRCECGTLASVRYHDHRSGRFWCEQCALTAIAALEDGSRKQVRMIASLARVVPATREEILAAVRQSPAERPERESPWVIS